MTSGSSRDPRTLHRIPDRPYLLVFFFSLKSEKNSLLNISIMVSALDRVPRLKHYRITLGSC